MDLVNYQFFQRLKELSFVEQIWLFGSRARGDNQDRADIDIALYCPNASAVQWQQVLDLIDEADTLLHIDCLRFDELNDSSDLKKAILMQGTKVYERKN